MLSSFIRLLAPRNLPKILGQLEQELGTVINVLQPGPLGIIEHKFSTEEVQRAKATVDRAVRNWRRNSALHKSGHFSTAAHPVNERPNQ